MTFFSDRFDRLRQWRLTQIARHGHRFDHLERWVMLAMLIVMLYALLLLPIDIFLYSVHAGRQVGQGAEAVLYLGTGGRIVLGGFLVLMIPASAVIGGLAKQTFGLFTSRWTMLLLVTSSGCLFAYVGHVYRMTVSQIDIAQGDHGTLVAFLTVWLFLIGYICKTPWDQARDLWCGNLRDIRGTAPRPPVTGTTPRD